MRAVALVHVVVRAMLELAGDGSGSTLVHMRDVVVVMGMHLGRVLMLLLPCLVTHGRLADIALLIHGLSPVRLLSTPVSGVVADGRAPPLGGEVSGALQIFGRDDLQTHRG